MPFITEEIWQYIEERKDGESIMICSMPMSKNYDISLIDAFEEQKQVIAFIRNTRIESQMGNAKPLSLWTKSDKNTNIFNSVLFKLGNLDSIERNIDEIPGRVATLVTPLAEYYIPLKDNINVEEQVKKLETELEYAKGFLESVNKKLSNEKFVSGAPKNVVDGEFKKKADAESKIEALIAQINSLKN
jgi:valyl-tRNA synthetase